MFLTKKKMLSYIAILGLIMILIGNSTIVAENKPDIVKMVGIIEQEQDLVIGDWSVYAREKTTDITTKQDFDKEVMDLKTKFPEFHWEYKEDTNGWKAIATYNDVEKGLTESINLMSTHQKFETTTYIIYEVKGLYWEKKYVSFLENTFQKRIKDIFRVEPSIYSCIRGTFNDNIETVLTSKIARLLDLFLAVEIESLKEPHFISISGTTKLFNQTLTEDQLNLQIAMREEGVSGKTTFVVGTPIITFEY